MMTPPADRAELLRHAALECLAARHPVALPLGGIRRRIATMLDWTPTDPDLVSALALLVDKGLAKSEPDTLGSSVWYSATADGLLRIERGNGQ